MRRSLLVGVLIAFAGGSAATQAPQIPEKFTNLKVLPADITRQRLVDIMRGYARGLGVRCEHCHLGEGNDLSKFDFASDDRPAKAIARKMIGMLASINEQLAKVGDPALEGTDKATCFSCHRGEKKPLTAPPAPGRGGASPGRVR
jgi:Photosynthetic reaction centre cytochrome C subunit